MAKKKQHYTPITYLEGWSLDGNDLFFYKDKLIDYGERRNPSSILFESHLYTVGYDEAVIIGACSRIREDFFNQTIEVLNNRNVYIVFEGKRVSLNPDNFFELFLKLDYWEFYYSNNDSKASNRKIYNEIKEIRSYLIEDQLDNMFEKRWKTDYNNFIVDINNKMEIVSVFNGNSDEVIVRREYIDSIIDFFAIQLHRNPKFNFFDMYIKSGYNYLYVLKKILNFDDKDSDQNRFLKNQVRCVHLYNLYESLFGANSELGQHRSYFEIITNTIKNGEFQVVIFHAGDSCFITSDNSAFVNKCYASRQIPNMIIFPLSYKYLLSIVKPKKEKMIERVICKGLSPNEVKEVNRIIYNNAYKAIISTKEYLSNNVW